MKSRRFGLGAMNLGVECWGDPGGDGGVAVLREKIGGCCLQAPPRGLELSALDARGESGDERDGVNWRPWEAVRREGVLQGVYGTVELWWGVGGF